MLDSTTTCSGTDLAGITQQTCTTVYGESTSTDPGIYYGFTFGEIVISVDLFIIFAVLCVIGYHVIFRRIKVKNQ